MTQTYDMVVLSTGMVANADTVKLCKESGIKTDKYGFIYCDDFRLFHLGRDIRRGAASPRTSPRQ